VKKSNWSKTLNIIQNIDDTTAAKAMYSQFERKTIFIIELKIRKGRRNNNNNNNPVLNDEDVLMDLVPFFSLSNSLNHLNRSASYQLLLEMKEKDMLQVKFLL
jgi:hypothetical protein